MKKIAIIAAMQEEIDSLLPKLTIKKEEQLKSFKVYICQYQTLEIFIILCGIGKVNSSVATTLLHTEYNPELIINLGSAAGLEPTLKPGDIVVADELSYYDVDVTVFNYQMGQVPKMPAFYKIDSLTLELMKTLYDDSNCHHIKYGLVLSGDSFLQCNNKIKEIRHHFPSVHAIDMESTAIAQACHRLNVPFLIIRSITDSGDDSAKDAHEEFLEFSQKKISDFITDLFDAINNDNVTAVLSK